MGKKNQKKKNLPSSNNVVSSALTTINQSTPPPPAEHLSNVDELLDAFNQLLSEQTVTLLPTTLTDVDKKLFLRTSYIRKRSELAALIHKNYKIVNGINGSNSERQLSLDILYQTLLYEKIDSNYFARLPAKEVYSTSLHEAGHAIGKIKLPNIKNYQTVGLLSVIPTEDSLGVTVGNFLSDENTIIWDRLVAKDYIIMLMCGYIAQTMCANEPCTFPGFMQDQGASSDRRKAQIQIEIGYRGKNNKTTFVEKWMQRYFADAMKFVRSEKESIIKLGKELFYQKSLTGNKVYEILDIERPQYDFEMVLQKENEVINALEIEEPPPLPLETEGVDVGIDSLNLSEKSETAGNSSKKKVVMNDPLALLGLKNFGTKKDSQKQNSQIKKELNEVNELKKTMKDLSASVKRTESFTSLIFSLIPEKGFWKGIRFEFELTLDNLNYPFHYPSIRSLKDVFHPCLYKDLVQTKGLVFSRLIQGKERYNNNYPAVDSSISHLKDIIIDIRDMLEIWSFDNNDEKLGDTFNTNLNILNQDAFKLMNINKNKVKLCLFFDYFCLNSFSILSFFVINS
jgi:ubiquitin-protein ligase